ncbi:MAG TPA: ABC transporter permease [candidate division Zixibacteria bacterium]|nr:ABC transporter permease [candidate division Zixibacteria bacterium]
MKYVARAVIAETLKLKRTMAWWVAFGAPLFVCGMFLAVGLKMNELPGRYNGDGWGWLISNVSLFWSVMVLPMIVALMSGLLSAYEHNSLGWKHLFALPISRSSIVITKYIAHHSLLIITSLAIVIEICGVGFLINAIRPDFGFAASPPITNIADMFLKYYLASWLIVALMQWMAIYIPNFTATLGVGIAGTFAGMVSATGWYQKLWPWKLIANTHAAIQGVPQLALVVGLGGGFVCTLIAIIHLSRREVL